MQTKDILIGLVCFLALVAGVVFLAQRNGEEAKTETPAETTTNTNTNTNTTERQRKVIRVYADTFLRRLNIDLGRLEDKISIEKDELNTKRVDLVIVNAERKIEIGYLKATYPELTKPQEEEIEKLISLIRIDREKIEAYEAEIELLDAWQTIVDNTRENKADMTAGQLGLRAVEIDGFIRTLEGEAK